MVSFYSEDLTSATGMPVAGLYRINQAVFQKHDYAGKAPMANVLRLQLVDADGATIDRYYSTGMAEANIDGTGLMSCPSISSNFGVLMAAFSEVGFPREKLQSGDIRVLIGAEAYWDFKEVDRGIGLSVSQVFVPTSLQVTAPPRPAPDVPAPAPPPPPMPIPPMPIPPSSLAAAPMPH